MDSLDLGLFYNRAGQPITMREWGEHFRQPLYKIVRQTQLRNGRLVSTVWLGADHRIGPGPPLIFETMVFALPSISGDLDQLRYATETEALAGHEAMVKKWSRLPNRRIKKLVLKRKLARDRRMRKRSQKRMRIAFGRPGRRS